MADGLSALSSETLTAAVTCLLQKPLPDSQFITSTPVTCKDQTRASLPQRNQSHQSVKKSQSAKLQPLSLPIYQAVFQNKEQQLNSNQLLDETCHDRPVIPVLQQSVETSQVKEGDDSLTNKIKYSVDNIPLTIPPTSEGERVCGPNSNSNGSVMAANLQNNGSNSGVKPIINNIQLHNLAALIGNRNNTLMPTPQIQAIGNQGLGLVHSIAGQGAAGISLLQQLINLQSHNTPFDIGSLPVLAGSVQQVAPSDVPMDVPFSQLSPTQPLQNLIHNLFSAPDASNLAQTSHHEEETYTATHVAYANMDNNTEFQSSINKQKLANLMPASKEQDNSYASHVNLLLEAISKNKTLPPQQFNQIQKSILGNIESEDRLPNTATLDQVQSSVLQGQGQGHVEIVHNEGHEPVLQITQKPLPFVLQRTSPGGQVALIPLTRLGLENLQQFPRNLSDPVNIQPKPTYFNVQAMMQPDHVNITGTLDTVQHASIEPRHTDTQNENQPDQSIYNNGPSHLTQEVQETSPQEVEENYNTTSVDTSQNVFSVEVQETVQSQDISENYNEQVTGETSGEDMDQQQEEDSYVFCIDCCKLCKDRCELHVNVDYKSIQDTPILSRARASLPPIFYLQQSSTSDVKDHLGVWCSECITERTRFGPVIGIQETINIDEYKQQVQGFNPYQLCTKENLTVIISVQDEDLCNWMMFVRMAHSLLEQNCILYKQGDQFYLITTSEIKEEEELLLWFSRELCQQLGISEDPGVVKMQQCEYCGKYFTTKKLLNSHLKTDHPQRYKYTCSFELCDKRFHTMSRLNNHMLTHMGMKPFECNRCGKRFSDASNVKAHMNIHTGEKRFQCETCGKKFRQKAHRDAHTITHTGNKNFKCSYCDKTFARQTDLKTHTYRHTNELQFPCTYCPKVFYKTQALKKHLKVHTGERNYMCGKCFKGFQTKYHRDRHLKICKEKNGKESSYMSLEEVAKLDSTCDAVPLKTVKPDDNINEQSQIEHEGKVSDMYYT